ncbi:MAG: hypothetical protein J6W14_06715, partial [Clostridia bacterium]|nr:hypothetical protein [Clostridia bacterium]
MNAKRTSPYTLLCGLIVVLTLIALLGLIALGIVRSMTPDAPAVQDPDDLPPSETAASTAPKTDAPSTDATTPEASEDVTLDETSDMGQAYLDSLIFVGDSTTA